MKVIWVSLFARLYPAPARGTLKFAIIGLLLLTLACTTTYAANPTPTPDPRKPAKAPSNIHVFGGLDRPTDKSDPGPYINASWGTPPKDISGIGIEILDQNGNSRPGCPGVIGCEILWLPYEGPELRDAGCGASNSHVRLTDDCLDRYKGKAPFKPFPKNFLRPGFRYEVRVGFFFDPREYEPSRAWSSVHRTSIPRPVTPTPTPRPTQTPSPTATPLPTNTPSPSESEMDRLFRENPALEEVWFRDNPRQYWWGYVRGDKKHRDLVRMVRGRPYWVVVSEEATVKGHRLYCCVNLIVW